jgi:hypothetical protein
MTMITNSPADEIAGEADLAPALRWEPCVAAATTDEHGLCADCGWLPEDHVDLAGVEGVGDMVRPNVVTMPVAERPRLRKAS